MTSYHVPSIEMHQALVGRVKQLESKLQATWQLTPHRPTFFTRQQACAALGCSLRTLERLIAKGVLKTRREGAKHGKVMVEVESIGQYMASTGTSRDFIETALTEAYYGI